MPNLLVNFQKREIGQIKSSRFISNYFENSLNNLELSKERNLNTSPFSVPWLSLETIEYRL